MFHRLSKHLQFRQKYPAARRIFNSLLGVWISRWNTVSHVWYITSYTGTVCLLKRRRKQKFHQIKLCLCVWNRWHLSGWSSCSKTCGRGVMTRELSCRAKLSEEPEEYKTVNESSCKEPKPKNLQKVCYKIACPAEWVPSPWGEVRTPSIGGVLIHATGAMQEKFRQLWASGLQGFTI